MNTLKYMVNGMGGAGVFALGAIFYDSCNSKLSDVRINLMEEAKRYRSSPISVEYDKVVADMKKYDITPQQLKELAAKLEDNNNLNVIRMIPKSQEAVITQLDESFDRIIFPAMGIGAVLGIGVTGLMRMREKKLQS
ncbi:hypothetical protein J4461_01900 [Candidatus Pacearchaeota archaeon]|nr:hypothetical protein [Candidatus Pacearchaeota archaeon]